MTVSTENVSTYLYKPGHAFRKILQVFLLLKQLTHCLLIILRLLLEADVDCRVFTAQRRHVVVVTVYV
jgi:hypothetical protein